jgi:hypothetical protein
VREVGKENEWKEGTEEELGLRKRGRYNVGFVLYCIVLYCTIDNRIENLRRREIETEKEHYHTTTIHDHDDGWMDGWIDGCNTVAPTHAPTTKSRRKKERAENLKKEEMR